MTVIEAESLLRVLEIDLKGRIAQFEKETDLIVDTIYVNRLSVHEIGAKKKSLLNSIDCEVHLL